jgi:hypothetical protein
MEESDYEKINKFFDEFVNSFEFGIFGDKIDYSNNLYNQAINEFISNYQLRDEIALADISHLNSS